MPTKTTPNMATSAPIESLELLAEAERDDVFLLLVVLWYSGFSLFILR